MRLNAFATAQHLEEVGAVKAHAIAMSPDDRHRLAFVLQVCDELKIERSFENVTAVSRAIAKEQIEPHIAHQYPKWVEAGDGTDVVVENEAQETFAAHLTPTADATPRKKPSPYPKAENVADGDGEAFPTYVAPAAPVQNNPAKDGWYPNDGVGENGLTKAIEEQNQKEQAKQRLAEEQASKELAERDQAAKERLAEQQASKDRVDREAAQLAADRQASQRSTSRK